MFLPSISQLLALSAPLLVHLPGVIAQIIRDLAPLFVQGGLENATATNSTYNTGGTITINGFTMLAPKNLLVEFRAAWVPWKDFVASQSDFIGFETLVMGNTVLGKPLVGQIVIFDMQIESGPVVRISDPNAIFSVGYGGAPFMTADDQSPSITSFSGFPMCIPRNNSDPLCPLSNRPAGTLSVFQAPDPLTMAPFLPGDFITFGGFRKGNEVIAFSLVAQNVQITTSDDIIYVCMELGLLGIYSNNPSAEVTDSRLIDFVSNPRATVSLHAMDVDPCTGATTDRLVAGVGLRGGRNFQNKFEYRNEILFGYTREYRAIVELNGRPVVRKTKNGLMAGTYVQPVNVWVPAEQDIPGVAPVPHEFREMAFLTKGVGRDDDGNLWGPLDPFPQWGVSIVPPNCAGGSGAFTPVHSRNETEPAPVKKRRIFGARIALVKAQAVADAENKGTEEAVVNVAPAEAAAIAVKDDAELEAGLLPEDNM
ncbi:hypothetical protein B0T25DRAFT_586527 [Lasiosphaeria hispida]|uniref:Peptidase A1 domain-containing protein n=1 Tax=Lasiosphaeria hispida TaxID=260671 RepID=A0AAJ0M861_9PEZI|nr:hypothetical protein B0T25DRAFT_586527 [Lasiosphaeria hispida]